MKVAKIFGVAIMPVKRFLAIIASVETIAPAKLGKHQCPIWKSRPHVVDRNLEALRD